MKKTLMVLCACCLAACGQPAGDAPPEQAVADSAAESVYAAAVAHEARSAKDRARDAGRQPAAVLEFVGIRPGMTVLDMFSGGGYYTEILSYVVGDSGRVFAHSNEAYLDFVGDEFAMRYLGGRLPNAEVLMAENNALSLAPESLDAIMLVLSFHDFYYADPDNGWPAIDVGRILGEFFDGLRPGGIVGIVDHYAPEGSPRETGGTTHRIDPAIVIEEMGRAGFELEARSDLLRNPDDDYERIAFDPELRGRTDRFVLRFRKPE